MPITPWWQGEQTTNNQGNQVDGSPDYSPLIRAAEAECRVDRDLLKIGKWGMMPYFDRRKTRRGE
jgi:hypothetical protein